MIPRILVTTFSLCLSHTAYCGVDLNACVGTAAELEAALVTSIGNGNTVDTIKIRAGTYKPATNPFGASGAFASGDSITIDGGWISTMAVPCQTQSTDPALTVIDGEGVRGGMQLWHAAGAGSITVRNLSFQNGYREYVDFANDRGGGLYILASAGATFDVLVERCIFRNNYASTLGGGLVASSSGGTITVRNNLFVGNTAPQGAAMHVFGNNNLSYVANNTVTGNISPQDGTSYAAFLPAGTNTLTLTNNIFWNNTSGTQSDLYGPDLLLVSNDIQGISGTPAAGSSGNLSVDPKFFGANDFRLLSWSPLIDIGTNSPLGGLSSLDLDGLTRVQSGTVDLGAYEYSFLFRNGFE